MANGQTSFNRRFTLAPIVAGQPPGTIPSENNIGRPALSNVRPPKKPQVPPEQVPPDEDSKQLLKEAKEVVARMQFQIEGQVRLQQRGAPIDLQPFLNVVMPEFKKATDTLGDALEQNGESRLSAEKNFALVVGRLPQVETTFTTIKADERRLREQGGESQVVVPASQTIPQGAVQSIGGEAAVQGQPPTPRAPTKPPKFIAIQNRRNQLTDVAAKLSREGRTEALKLVQNSIKELDAKLRKESTPKEPTSTLFETKDGKNFLKPAVSNSLRQSVARLFGGLLDPATGKFILLDPKQGPKAVALNALAETMILSGEETSVANAVQSAGRTFGVSFPSTEDETAREEALRQARESIKQGAPVEAVKGRLQEMGIDPALL